MSKRGKSSRGETTQALQDGAETGAAPGADHPDAAGAAGPATPPEWPLVAGAPDGAPVGAPADAPLTPRETAMLASCAAMATLMAYSSGDIAPATVRGAEPFARGGVIFDVLDASPDLPASAIGPALAEPDLPIVAAEALKATYVGLACWVQAEQARLDAAAAPRPAARPSRYEKSGREERVGAKAGDRVR